jgi:CubicO group peptidase (beta-lactamase class C family)
MHSKLLATVVVLVVVHAASCSSPRAGTSEATSSSTSASATTSTSASSAGGGPDPAAIQKVIDDAVGPVVAAAGSVGIVVGVIDDGASVLATYGEAVHGSGTKPTGTTLFQIGSNTKCFTATLLARAVNGGGAQLSDTLASAMPAGYQFAPGAEQQSITLLELADHTSGLSRNPTVTKGATTFSVDQVYSDADSALLMNPPGAMYSYSNLGYALLGYALANKASTTWDALLASVITSPLGMPDTALYAELSSAQLARTAQGYDTNCTSPPCAVDKTLVLATFPAPGIDPAGSLWSTGKDMMVWLSFNMGLSGPSDLTALLPMLRKTRVSIPSQDVGLAWNSSAQTARGKVATAWKPGDTNGFHSYVVYAPSVNAGVFVMMNYEAGTWPTMLGSQILGALP